METRPEIASTPWLDVEQLMSSQDLGSPDGTPYPPYLLKRARTLLTEYAAICRLAEEVFPIISGYQSPSQHSQFRNYTSDHMLGYAIDLAPVGDWTVPRMAVYAHMQSCAQGSAITGIGIYRSWLHVDVRPRRIRKIWRGADNVRCFPGRLIKRT